MSIKRLGSNLGSGAASRILSAALGLVLIVLMTRIWDPDNLGRYVVAFSWFQLLQLVPLLGLHFELARDTGAGADEVRARLATAALIGTGCAVLVGLALAGAGALLSPDTLLLAFAGSALALVPSAPIAVAEMALLGQERLHVVALVNTAESVLRCVVLGALILSGAGVAGVLIGFAALRLAALAVYLCDASLRHLLDPRAADRGAARRQWQRAPVLLAVLVLSAAFSRLDVALMPLVAGLDDVGVYAIAARLYDLALMVPSVLVMALLPVFSRLGGDDRAVEALGRLTLRYALGLGIPLALVAAWAGEPVLSAIFGARYGAAVAPFRLLLAATLVTGVSQMMSCILLARDLQRLDLPCLALGCGVLVAGIVLLVPVFGIAGAALAALIGACAQCALRAWLLDRLTGIRVLTGDLAGPLAGAAVAIAILLALPDRALVAYPAALLGYGLALIGLRGMRGGDPATLRNLLAHGGPAPLDGMSRP